MNKMFILLCFALLSPFTPHLAGAGSGDGAVVSSNDLTKLSIEELMQVEVATVYSASKFEQKVTEAPSSVSIVTADEIRMYGHRTLADILRSLRSFFVTYDRNYNYAGVRGFGRAGDFNSRILLLVDGHRINDNLYDSAPVGTEFPVDIDLVDRVEVIRGPGSSLYGSNAFFAVINVITRRGGETGGVELSGDTGSFDTYKGRLTWGGSFKNGLEALVSGSYYDSNGDRLFFKEFDRPDTGNGVTDHTDYDRFHNTLAKLSYGGFTLEGAYSSRTKGVPTAAFGADFNDRSNKTVDSWWFLDLKYSHTLWSRLDLSGRLFYDSYDYDGDAVYDGVLNKDRGWGRWWGGELQGAVKILDSHRLVAGVEYRDNIRQDQKTYDDDPYYQYIDDRRSSRVWSLYLQDEFTIFKSLILNGGVRYDHYSTFGGTVNPRVALIYTPIDGSVIKILYGSAFRPPNVMELYYDAPDLGQKGNPGLEPEEIRTCELIFEQYMGRNIRGTIAGFYYTINDLIVPDPADPVLVFRNLDKVEAKGVEVELDGNWDNGISGRVSYSFQDVRDDNTGKTLANSPRNLAKANLTLPLLKERLFMGIEEQFTDRRKTVIGNHANAYFVTNLTLFSRNLLENLDISASLYNLFDHSYGDPGGDEHVQDTDPAEPSRFRDRADPLDIIRQDGRTFRVKLTYRF